MVVAEDSDDDGKKEKKEVQKNPKEREAVPSVVPFAPEKKTTRVGVSSPSFPLFSVSPPRLLSSPSLLPSSSSVIWSDIQVLDKVLSIAEDSTQIWHSHPLPASPLSTTTGMPSLGPLSASWPPSTCSGSFSSSSSSRQRFGILYYHLLCEILQQKMDVMNLLTAEGAYAYCHSRDVKEKATREEREERGETVWKKMRSAMLETQSTREDVTGSFATPNSCASPTSSSSSSPNGFPFASATSAPLWPSCTPTSPGLMMDMHLLPPGLEEEDYREEECFLNRVHTSSLHDDGGGTTPQHRFPILDSSPAVEASHPTVEPTPSHPSPHFPLLHTAPPSPSPPCQKPPDHDPSSRCPEKEAAAPLPRTRTPPPHDVCDTPTAAPPPSSSFSVSLTPKEEETVAPLPLSNAEWVALLTRLWANVALHVLPLSTVGKTVGIPPAVLAAFLPHAGAPHSRAASQASFPPPFASPTFSTPSKGLPPSCSPHRAGRGTGGGEWRHGEGEEEEEEKASSPVVGDGVLPATDLLFSLLAFVHGPNPMLCFPKEEKEEEEEKEKGWPPPPLSFSPWFSSCTHSLSANSPSRANGEEAPYPHDTMQREEREAAPLFSSSCATSTPAETSPRPPMAGHPPTLGQGGTVHCDWLFLPPPLLLSSVDTAESGAAVWPALQPHEQQEKCPPTSILCAKEENPPRGNGSGPILPSSPLSLSSPSASSTSSFVPLFPTPFSFSFLIASLRWNASVLLWADGAVEDCGKWLSRIPMKTLWEEVREGRGGAPAMAKEGGPEHTRRHPNGPSSPIGPSASLVSNASFSSHTLPSRGLSSSLAASPAPFVFSSSSSSVPCGSPSSFLCERGAVLRGPPPPAWHLMAPSSADPSVWIDIHRGASWLTAWSLDASPTLSWTGLNVSFGQRATLLEYVRRRKKQSSPPSGTPTPIPLASPTKSVFFSSATPEDAPNSPILRGGGSRGVPFKGPPKREAKPVGSPFVQDIQKGWEEDEKRKEEELFYWLYAFPSQYAAHSIRLLHRMTALRDCTRLILSAGESFGDVVVLLHYLHRAMEDEKAFLQRQMHARQREREVQVDSVRSTYPTHCPCRKGEEEVEEAPPPLPSPIRQETHDGTAEHPADVWKRTILEAETLRDQQHVADRVADLLAHVLWFLHVVVEYTLSRRVRFLLRHQWVISHKRYAAAFATPSKAENIPLPVSPPYEREMEAKAVRQACDECVFWVTQGQWKTLDAVNLHGGGWMRAVEVPFVRSPPTDAEGTHPKGRPVGGGRRPTGKTRGGEPFGSAEKHPPPHRALPHLSLPPELVSHVLHQTFHFSSSYATCSVYQRVSVGEAYAFAAFLDTFVQAYHATCRRKEAAVVSRPSSTTGGGGGGPPLSPSDVLWVAYSAFYHRYRLDTDAKMRYSAPEEANKRKKKKRRAGLSSSSPHRLPSSSPSLTSPRRWISPPANDPTDGGEWGRRSKRRTTRGGDPTPHGNALRCTVEVGKGDADSPNGPEEEFSSSSSSSSIMTDTWRAVSPPHTPRRTTSPSLPTSVETHPHPLAPSPSPPHSQCVHSWHSGAFPDVSKPFCAASSTRRWRNTCCHWALHLSRDTVAKASLVDASVPQGTSDTRTSSLHDVPPPLGLPSPLLPAHSHEGPSHLLWLPSRGWIPLLPEETANANEDATATPAKGLRAASSSSSFASDGHALTALVRHSSPSVSLRLCVMLYHVRAMEEESIRRTEAEETGANQKKEEEAAAVPHEGSLERGGGGGDAGASPPPPFSSMRPRYGGWSTRCPGGVELLPPASLFRVASECNKALYLLPLRIRMLQATAEEAQQWWGFWQDTHQNTIQPYYTKAVNAILSLTEGWEQDQKAKETTTTRTCSSHDTIKEGEKGSGVCNHRCLLTPTMAPLEEDRAVGTSPLTSSPPCQWVSSPAIASPASQVEGRRLLGSDSEQWTPAVWRDPPSHAKGKEEKEKDLARRVAEEDENEKMKKRKDSLPSKGIQKQAGSLQAAQGENPRVLPSPTPSPPRPSCSTTPPPPPFFLFHDPFFHPAASHGHQTNDPTSALQDPTALTRLAHGSWSSSACSSSGGRMGSGGGWTTSEEDTTAVTADSWWKHQVVHSTTAEEIAEKRRTSRSVCSDRKMASYTSLPLLPAAPPPPLPPPSLPTPTWAISWDFPPFFLPFVRLDISAFRASSLETQESMKKNAIALSRLQAHQDALYRQQILQRTADPSQSALAVVASPTDPSPAASRLGGEEDLLPYPHLPIPPHEHPIPPCSTSDASPVGPHDRMPVTPPTGPVITSTPSLFPSTASLFHLPGVAALPFSPSPLCMLNGPMRHLLHSALPFTSQFMNWKVMYSTATHGYSLQTLYQCLTTAASSASLSAPKRPMSASPPVAASAFSFRSSLLPSSSSTSASSATSLTTTATPVLLLIEVSPSFSWSFERDGSGVLQASQYAKQQERHEKNTKHDNEENEKGSPTKNGQWGKAPSPTPAPTHQKSPHRLIIGAYLTDLLVCDRTRRYYGGSDCFVFQLMLQGDSGGESAPPATTANAITPHIGTARQQRNDDSKRKQSNGNDVGRTMAMPPPHSHSQDTAAAASTAALSATYALPSPLVQHAESTSTAAAMTASSPSLDTLSFPLLKVFHSSKENTQFINCRKTSVVIGGGTRSAAGSTTTMTGDGSAIFLDQSLTYGATASCPTFRSPPLTECTFLDDGEVPNNNSTSSSSNGVKSFEITRVEAILFEE